MKAVREAIEAVGARLLFLPPDSPDLNPIEPFFAKRKALLRTAARRTIDALCNAIATALDAFSPDQCRNHIANSGHSHSQEDGASTTFAFFAVASALR